MLAGGECELALHSTAAPAPANEIETFARVTATVRWGLRDNPAFAEIESDADLVMAAHTPVWASVGCWRAGVDRADADALLATSQLVAPVTDIGAGQIGRLTPLRERMQLVTDTGAVKVVTLGAPGTWAAFGTQEFLEKLGLSGGWLEMSSAEPGTSGYAASTRSLRSPTTVPWALEADGLIWATEDAIVLTNDAGAVTPIYVSIWDAETSGRVHVAFAASVSGTLPANGMADFPAGSIRFGYDVDMTLPV